MSIRSTRFSWLTIRALDHRHGHVRQEPVSDHVSDVDPATVVGVVGIDALGCRATASSPSRCSLARRTCQSELMAFYDRMIEGMVPRGVSGLGLARIRADAGLDLDDAIDGDELTLVVHSPVSRPPPLGSPAAPAA